MNKRFSSQFFLLVLLCAIFAVSAYLYFSIENQQFINTILVDSDTVQTKLPAQNSQIIKDENLEKSLELDSSLFSVDLSPESDEELTPPFIAKKVTYKNNTLDVFMIQLDRKKIDLFSYNELTKKPIRSILDLKNYVQKKHQKKVLFATNGGIFHASMNPVGLYVEKGIEKIPLNTTNGNGNFFLKPNGVFCISKVNEKFKAKIIEAQTTEYQKIKKNLYYGIQSGPLLLIDGKVHPKFNPNSPNKKLRSGVGVFDKRNFVIFAISNQPITFHDFATFFKEKYKCDNALYLDGVISKMYIDTPNFKRTKNGDGQFGTLIGVIE